MRKNDEHIKLCLSSLTRKFICYYTFKVVVEKNKQNMNWVIHVSWTKRNNMTWGEEESRHRLWIILLVFCCSSNILVHWFHLHSCALGIKLLFGAHPVIFISTFLWLVFNCFLYIITSPSHLTFKPESSPYFRLCQREDISVSGGSKPVQKIWDLCSFSSHSLVTG